MNLLGLDIGTTSCKALLFDTDGTLVAKAWREYSVDFPNPQWAEQDLENVWQLAQEAIREAIVAAHVSEITAIGLSVHGEALTPVDKGGRSTPHHLRLDRRSPTLAATASVVKPLFQHRNAIHTIIPYRIAVKATAKSGKVPNSCWSDFFFK
jgi:sugar (pentulose or hexulose) kinase